MKVYQRYFVSNLGVEWAMLTLAPLPLLLIFQTPSLPIPLSAKIFLASASVVLNMLFAYFVLRRPKVGKLSGLLSVVIIYISVFPLMDTSPFYTLAGNIVFISLFFLIIDIKVHSSSGIEGNISEKNYERARWALNTFTIVLFLALMLRLNFDRVTLAVIFASFAVAQTAFFKWAYRMKIRRNMILSVFIMLAGVLVVFYAADFEGFALLVLNLMSSSVLFLDREYEEKPEHWWDVLLSHPARILFTSFFLLCMMGTLLLLIPASTVKGDISFVDAVFTSVSAVCVTGLIVLDTPNDFTFTGQFFILLMIQLGGLGIMSITTIAIQSLGRRLSLKHETVLVSMTETDHRTLVSSLSMILKYTFVIETAGFIILSILFYFSGDGAGDALWRGFFTAISAFCNAGFAIQSDSLIGYSGSPLILNTVAVLIFLGGMAPAIAFVIPAWVKGEKIPVTARIALVTTAVLILAGTLFILVFEWNRTLGGLGFTDKLFNALFQSVTLRTAGFNSIDIAHISSPTFMLMIIFMFIGGSPGGTAGGIKTTTIGVLMMTYWSYITNRPDILVRNVKVSQTTVNKAVTIMISGFIIWLIAVTMVEVTQQIPARDLIFEVTSAIGTVGLSTGITAHFDQIGKFIIIVTMFAGRIGPMTLFTFLSSRTQSSGTEYTETGVTLT